MGGGGIGFFWGRGIFLGGFGIIRGVFAGGEGCFGGEKDEKCSEMDGVDGDGGFCLCRAGAGGGDVVRRQGDVRCAEPYGAVADTGSWEEGAVPWGPGAEIVFRTNPKALILPPPFNTDGTFGEVGTFPQATVGSLTVEEDRENSAIIIDNTINTHKGELGVWDGLTDHPKSLPLRLDSGAAGTPARIEYLSTKRPNRNALYCGLELASDLVINYACPLLLQNEATAENPLYAGDDKPDNSLNAACFMYFFGDITEKAGGGRKI